MFPNIRLGKEINICNVQQMSCVHSMWWTSGLQTVSVCGLRPFVLGSRKYFAVKYTENLNQWITWHKQILCWLKLGTCKMKLNLSRCTNSGFQDINILMKGVLLSLWDWSCDLLYITLASHAHLAKHSSGAKRNQGSHILVAQNTQYFGKWASAHSHQIPGMKHEKIYMAVVFARIICSPGE